jgi:hypothetical protein
MTFRETGLRVLRDPLNLLTIIGCMYSTVFIDFIKKKTVSTLVVETGNRLLL